jgi:hypothetical protein
VSTALNSGVPLALSGNTEMATQFDKFIRRNIATGSEAAEPAAAGRRNALGIHRLASIW